MAPLREPSSSSSPSTLLSNYFAAHDHEIEHSEHEVLLALERSARCRHTTKILSRIGFTVTPMPLIFVAISLLTTDFEDTINQGASAPLDASQQENFAVASIITSAVVLLLIITYLIVQLDEHRVLARYHRSVSDPNVHILGHDNALFRRGGQR